MKYVCRCARSTEEDIVKLIKETKITDIDEFVKETKIGSYCGACIRPGGHRENHRYLVDILKEVKEEMDESLS